MACHTYERLALPGLSDAVIGGLAYLYDSHVHDASRYTGAHVNFMIDAERTKGPLTGITARLRGFLGKHLVRERHLQGTWPAYIHPQIVVKNMHSVPLLTVTDYNLFTTASTAYALLMFDDRHLPEKQKIIGYMLHNTSRTIRGFRRNEAYNFWITRNHPRKMYPCSGPVNIPVSLLGLRQSFYRHAGLFDPKDFKDGELLTSWVLDCFNKRLNPSGGEAIFNIPNDADNTSMAAGFQVLYHHWLGQPVPADDTKPLECLPLYRDLDRPKIKRYYRTIEDDTGAFLTWLKDEHLPIFSFPERGIIPLYENNVDIVVNANVIFALSLANRQSTPGYREAVGLIFKAVEQRKWMDTTVYYPQKFVFPYAVSRAWRDAGARDPLLEKALSQLLVQILDDPIAIKINTLSLSAKSPSHIPDDFIHATTLVLITLLNTGKKMAEESGLSDPYDQLVEKATLLLLSHRKTLPSRHKNTFRVFPGIPLYFWESGILYSSSLQKLAHWRSHPQLTSLVLEALAKYVLGYDLLMDKLPARRLSLVYDPQKESMSLQPTTKNRELEGINSPHCP